MEEFYDEIIKEKIKELGKLWKNSDSNLSMFIKKDVVDSWEKIILTWANDDEMPLVVRKSSDTRGTELLHKSGRRIIISDNSLSQWIYCNVLKGNTYSYEKIKEMLLKDEIPFSFAIKKKDIDNIKYKKILGKENSVNEVFHSKLCHIEPVGLRTRKKITSLDIEILKNHFIKLGNPKNMFLLPLEIGSLGEIKEFIDQQR